MRRMPAHWAIYAPGTVMQANRIRLAIDARYASDHFPGIGRVVTALAHAWAENPRIGTLHIIQNPTRQNTYLSLPAESERVIHHFVDGAIGSFHEGQHVRRLANTLPVDWFYSPYLRLPWGRFRPHTLVTLHDVIPLTVPHTAWVTRLGYALAVRIAAARATCLTTVSQAAADSIAPFIWPSRTPAIVPNGVDERFFVLPARTTTDAEAAHRPYALCVSSNQPHKNLDALVAAWHMLADASALGGSAALIIAGHVNPARNQPWRNTVPPHYPILHVASPSDARLISLYHNAHMVVQPSLAEGFGLPVLEALAGGAVVLCHDLPVYQTTAGAAVTAIDMQRPESIAAGMASLWHDSARRKRQQHAGPIQARRADWHAAAERMIDVMQKNTSCR